MPPSEILLHVSTTVTSFEGKLMAAKKLVRGRPRIKIQKLKALLEQIKALDDKPLPKNPKGPKTKFFDPAIPALETSRVDLLGRCGDLLTATV